MLHQRTKLDKMKITNCASIYNTLAGLAGYLSAVSAGLSITISSACAQKLNGIIPAFELNAWRYAAEVFLSACLVVFTRRDVRISYIKVPWMILLTVLSVILNTAVYTAAIYLSLGILSLSKISISYVVTLLLSKRFLYKQTVCFQHVAFIIILVGQFLLLQPCFLFQAATCHNDLSILINATNKSINPELEYSTSPSSSSSLIGYALVVVASMTLSLRQFVYRCQVPDISPSVVSLWTSTLGLLLSLVIMIYFETPIILLENLDIWLLIGHAGCTACAALLSTYSQQNLHPIVYTILLNSKVVFGFVLEIAFPHVFIQSVHNILEFVGIALCVLGMVLYMVINFRMEKLSDINNY